LHWQELAAVLAWRTRCTDPEAARLLAQESHNPESDQ
jgi:hypothetical protein